MQEAGRAGRDGHISHAILYEGHVGKSLDKRINKKIQQYADADFSSKNFLNFVKRNVAVVMCVLGNVHVKTVKKK